MIVSTGSFRDPAGRIFEKDGEIYRGIFRPGTEDFERLVFLTDLYFVEPLEYDVELILAGTEARTVCLGDPARASLGVDSWIFSTPELGEMRAIFSPQPTPPEPLWTEQQNKFLGDKEEVTS